MYRYIKASRTDDYINEYYDDLYGDEIVEDVVDGEISDYDYDYDYYDDAPTQEDEQQLRDFYNANIKDKTDYGIDTYEVYKLDHELWHTLKTEKKYTYLYDFMKSPEFIEMVSKKFNVAPDQLVAAINYVEAWETYSDWYKDLYGIRPRG